MDAMTIEKMLSLLINGMETLNEALRLALMKYQDLAEEERHKMHKEKSEYERT